MVIKRVYRFLIVSGLFILILAGLLLSLRLPKVQTLLVNGFLNRIEKNYDGELSVGQVFIRWPHRLELKDILILDPINDTLLYAASLEASIIRIDLDRNRFRFNRVSLTDPLVQLRELPDGSMNYQALFNSFNGQDSTSPSKPVSLSFNQVLIRRGAFAYSQFGSLDKPDRMDLDRLRISGIETQIERIGFSPDSVYGHIAHLGCQEQSGFRISDLSVRFCMDSSGIHTRMLELLTGNSHLNSPLAVISDLTPEGADTTRPHLEAILGAKSYISPVDISLLTGINAGITDVVEISGRFTGNLNSGDFSDTRIQVGNLVHFEGDLSYDYPGTLKEAWFDLHTRNLKLNLSGLQDQLFSGQVPELELEIPEVIGDLGQVAYSGTFRGTIENFITTGVFYLPYGDFTTDLKVVKNTSERSYNFQGSVATTGFNPDEFLENGTGISDVDLTLNVDGDWDGKKDIHALIQADIRRLTLNSYPFRALLLTGQIDGQTFAGSLNARDPNLRLDLKGLVDFGKETRRANLDLMVYEADLNALNLIRNDTIADLALNLHGEVEGKDLDDLTGFIRIINSSYRNSNGVLPIRELTVTARPEAGQRQIILASEYIDARLSGDIHIDRLPSQIQSLVARFVPALTDGGQTGTERMNDFAINLHLKDPAPVARIVTPGFQCKDNTRLNGFYDAQDQVIYLEGVSPQLALGRTQFTQLDIRLQSRGDSLILTGMLDKMQIDRNNQFENISLDALLSANDLKMSLNWNNSQGPENRGNIGMTGRFGQSPEGKLAGIFDFAGAEVVYNDSLWRIDPFTLDYQPERLGLSGIFIRHREESLAMAGAVSLSPADTLFVTFNQVNLDHLNQVTRSDDLMVNGLLSGNARFFDLKGKGMFLADLEIDSLQINGQMLGTTTLSSKSGGTGEPVFMHLLTRRGSIRTIQVNGTYNPASDSLDFAIDLDKLRMDIFNPFVGPDLREVKGILTGGITVTGPRNQPQLRGDLLVQKGSLVIDYLNTRFFFTHRIQVTPDAFILNEMDVQDDEGNHAMLNGAVRHDNFNHIRLDFALECKDFVALNADESKNDGYWGRGYATGVATIRGPLRNLMIDVSATTSPKTRFFVPVNTAGEARELAFITYVEKPREELEPDLVDFTVDKPRGYEVNLYGATVNIDLAVTPDAEVQLIFDSKVGDVLRARGSGDIRIYVDPKARWTITGDYMIEEGDYQFTLQGMPIKKLEIEPGGTLKWTRDIATAQLDVDAVYRTKASLYDLLQDESNSDLTQRLPVECHVKMSGRLENPAISFDVVVPSTTDDLARSQLANLTEEEMSKQIISLLLLNRFTPLQGAGSGTSKGYATAGLTTTTEVLSNQLSYWLSQISKDFDFGFNYRPGDELTSDEVEVALSKQFLNNRMTINVNGNYDVRQTNANASQLVGDVEVEYKIKPSGKLRVKAFTRANDHLLYEYAPYTQGVGLFFREEFDTFGELFSRYRRKLAGSKR